MPHGCPLEVLLINGGGFRQSFQHANLHTMDDGGDALLYLRREGKYAGVPATDLVLLELGLRGLDGHVLLAQIKRDPALTRIPVIVLGRDQDARRCYDAHANCFIPISPDTERFSAALAVLRNFWFDHAILPPH